MEVKLLEQLVKLIFKFQFQPYSAISTQQNTDLEKLNYFVERDSDSNGQNTPQENYFNFFCDSFDQKSILHFSSFQQIEDDQSNILISNDRSIQNISTLEISNIQTNQHTKNEKSYLKNFLILFSGWIRNHFIQLYQQEAISLEDFHQFQRMILKPNQRSYTSKRNKRGTCLHAYQKTYINLKKLTKLFNHECLKPHISNFLDFHLLRYLVSSKTKNKSCILKLLPVLKNGLISGKISHLR